MPETQVSDSKEQVDPHRWLEEVEGKKALDWVRQQNKRSLAEISSDPNYAENLQKALVLATDKDRIPYASVRGEYVYNFWQDAKNTRGLWRRTTLESYRTDKPDWETVLDIDALAKKEAKNWVYKRTDCFKPKGASKYLCMLSLSDGGKDAIVKREFDLQTKQFVKDGFVMSEAKQNSAWIDHDTLLVATDWGGDGSTLTESGYPSSIRLWKRGQPLEDAKELFRGDKKDVATNPWSQELDNGEVIYGAYQASTFFTSNVWLLSDGKPVKLPIPPKASLGDVYQGQQFVTLQQDWVAPRKCMNAEDCQGGTINETFQNGDLVAFDLHEFLKTKKLPPVALVFRANERQAVQGVSVADGVALLSINDNVVGKVLRLELSKTGWTTEAIDLPENGQVGVVFADHKEKEVFFYYQGFLTPDSLLEFDSKTGAVSKLKSIPAKFDAEGLIVSQKEAISNDGTKIPYFVVHRKDVTLDGKTPTLLYGYGGFEVSMTPSYSAQTGKLWLEKGGAYVLANIRGGGEFGPEWHQAGLKQHRQRIYDDFIAVAETLIKDKFTAPEHLGIMGGSNGGLLMGVMMMQRPKLWNAVVVQVPLLDMLRYHTLLAGASWVDEYGDPDIPEERAFLETISPYHNFDPKADYPTPLFVTSTKDDRVHPAHARKMAKLFEDAGKPFLYYENIDGGHSAAANKKEAAKKKALEFTYLYERLFEKE
ncbi:MAG: Prolyl endopeptidase (EC [uncultured Thiotrichaceae bacterium]|uniref:Prolyl endopeptidase (EC) n=1 Tax=uncultured Thiotrichaceae bacterium TaxID=298394 RepID=A0A6S6SME7_9GAMM|nr:MAG: Prolyl endopeptidase (EC [uncultured Thiotrichaceae bacterium]